MISKSDWKRINHIVLIIHSEADLDIMRAQFFEAVEVLIPYEKAMFYLIDERDNQMKLKDPVFVNVDDSFAMLYKKVFEEFKYGRVAISARRTMAFHDTELMTGNQKEVNDMFQSFMKPYNIPYGAGIEIAKDRKPTAEISFFRTEEQGDFTKREIGILEVLKDHLEVRINNNINTEDADELRKIKLIDFGLTQREIELITLVETDSDINKIANDLNITKSTVKRHLHNIYEKLDVSGRLELISFIHKI